MKKKIVLMVAGALCLGAAVYAQEPSTNAVKDSTATQQQADPSTQAQPAPQTQEPATQAQEPATQSQQPATQAQPSTDAATATPAYRKDMTQVQASDVPTGLRSTLDRPQFKGWETGGVYTNADKSVYIVEIKDEVEGRLKAYRFDANGKPITDNK
jgi:hypothetical protein